MACAQITLSSKLMMDMSFGSTVLHIEDHGDSDMMDIDMLLPIERQFLDDDMDMDFEDQTFRPRPSVAFDNQVDIVDIDSCKTMTSEEKNAVWFQAHDLEAFKQSARDLVRSKRKGSDDDTLRGLERYGSRRKCDVGKTIRTIVRAQRTGLSKEQLSNIVISHGMEATEVAVLTAAQDFYDAYLSPSSFVTPTANHGPWQ